MSNPRWPYFQTGTYMNGVTWESLGSSFINPATVTSIQEIPGHRGSIIHMFGQYNTACVRETPDAVMDTFNIWFKELELED